MKIGIEWLGTSMLSSYWALSWYTQTYILRYFHEVITILFPNTEHVSACVCEWKRKQKKFHHRGDISMPKDKGSHHEQ